MGTSREGGALYVVTRTVARIGRREEKAGGGARPVGWADKGTYGVRRASPEATEQVRFLVG
jgi:hypothetical protein